MGRENVWAVSLRLLSETTSFVAQEGLKLFENAWPAYIYIYIYIRISLSLSLSFFIMYIYIYIYVYPPTKVGEKSPWPGRLPARLWRRLVLRAGRAAEGEAGASKDKRVLQHVTDSYFNEIEMCNGVLL